MSIPYPCYSSPLPIKLENGIVNQPLDLSFNSLEKKAIQQFKDKISIQQISKELDLSIDRIYSIISKTSLVKIKNFKKYTSDIKNRVKEAKNAGKTLAEIAKIFNLKPHQALYINRFNRSLFVKQLYHSINIVPNRGSPMTVKKLKDLLHHQHIQRKA
ncbi:hypothetical protein [Candidatus Rhabdochlamydia porcellionis]|jgi:hypothetical protein|uniref:RNA polymerase sigma-70 region 4 domain-containing protein n=1 Tax=Candidatus Rhabdochlamydia porcellionis TaxID=225148 RepID=A0ABX8Z0P4_9BACT|nr:hypothetical protein [Candidatus Rhabdochlamydia porcellionis]QZA59234.1 hypothetical protein RHAB15C_0001119 [Candidatus Rhabdochlamydia porcellionis]